MHPPPPPPNYCSRSATGETPDSAARPLRLVPTTELMKYFLYLATNMADVQVKNIDIRTVTCVDIFLVLRCI